MSSKGAGTNKQQTNHALHATAGTVSRVPTNNLKVKPISATLVATTIKPSSKPTTLPAKSSKQECHREKEAAQLRNAVTPTSPTMRIQT